jgi:uncharacterized phage infection (PIP) family protein YhgE
MFALKLSRASMTLVLVLPIMLQACAGQNDDAGSGGVSLFDSASDDDLTHEERALREEADVFNETVFGGAATGAAILGGLCVLSGLLNNKNLSNCLVAAGVGAAIGALDGYLVAKRQEASRKGVREIDLVAQDVEKDNEKIARVNAQARKVRDQNIDRIRDAEEKRRNQQISAEQLARERDRLRDNISFLQETIDKLEERRDQYEKAAQQLRSDGRGDTTELQAKIDQQTDRIEALKRMKRDLERANEVKRIG